MTIRAFSLSAAVLALLLTLPAPPVGAQPADAGPAPQQTAQAPAPTCPSAPCASWRACRRATAWRCTARSSIRKGFDHFDYVNPDAPKGGTAKMPAEGTYDSFNPYILKGSRAVDVADLRDADGVERRRGVQPIRPDRQAHLHAGRPRLGRLHAARGRALARRRADHGRGRDLELQHAEGEGPPAVPLLLQVGHRGPADRPAHRAFRVRRRGQPRTAADRGPDADPAQALLDRRRPDLRPVDAGAAAGLRPLPDQRPRARPLRRVRAGRGLLGPRSAGEPRALEFRQDPVRLLPRSDRDPLGGERPATSTSGWKTKPSRGPRPTTCPRCARAG